MVNNEENSGVHPKHCSPNRRATESGYNVCSSLCDAAFRNSRPLPGSLAYITHIHILRGCAPRGGTPIEICEISVSHYFAGRI